MHGYMQAWINEHLNAWMNVKLMKYFLRIKICDLQSFRNESFSKTSVQMASFFPEWSQAIIPNDQERFLENKAGHVHGYQISGCKLASTDYPPSCRCQLKAANVFLQMNEPQRQHYLKLHLVRQFTLSLLRWNIADSLLFSYNISLL